MTERLPALITVSGTIPPTLADDVAAGVRPRADYAVLAEELHADLLDYTEARRRCGRFGRLIERFAGANALLAWATFRVASRYESVLTDGEQIGLPYAALCRLRRRSRLPRHSMIVHIMSVKKKVLLFKALRLRSRIDTFIVYSTRQRDFAVTELRMPPDGVELTTFMVDGGFWSMDPVHRPGRRMICSAGLEFRDYETLVAAVGGLDVDVVIAAASPWSKRSSAIDDSVTAPNVTVTKLGFEDLRQLYADALFVVMPLIETEFQAGITTILEAMAMGKALVCTRTTGQTDTVVDGVTGLYVSPGDTAELRLALQQLLNDPAEAERLGRAGRDRVQQTADLPVYAKRLARIVHPTP